MEVYVGEVEFEPNICLSLMVVAVTVPILLPNKSCSPLSFRKQMRIGAHPAAALTLRPGVVDVSHVKISGLREHRAARVAVNAD